MSLMESIIAALLASGKGILAADESFPTLEKRFMENMLRRWKKKMRRASF
jgi:fructose-bisphosphate aldolase class 1